MNPWYKDYAEFLGELFPGKKVQKISINAGTGCPNRDGTLGRGGCIYCDNTTFSPAYCHEPLSVRQQIEAGKKFFAGKYPQMKYLAYFQNFTGTYGPREELLRKYCEAVETDGVEGIVIGTRPDCIDSEMLGLLADINRRKPVIMEYGAETSHDDTLCLINRHHTWKQTVSTVQATASAGLFTGLHLILGLPGEDISRMIATVERVVSLPVHTVKFHQLQVIRNTPLHKMLEAGEISLPTFSLENYIDLCCRIVTMIPRRIAIERFLSSSPPDKVVSPKWGLKNYQFINLLHNQLKKTTHHNK